jgi:hypothetical protein
MCDTKRSAEALWVFEKNGWFFAVGQQDSKLEINRRFPGSL